MAAAANGPEIIDIHLHLCRDVNQERLVFPKDGWPDEWYWGNPDAVIPYMNERGVSHVATQNIMDTGRMVEARLARVRAGGASDEEVERVRLDLAEGMRERVRGFNDWACETHAEEPRIIPFVMIDPVLFGEAASEELDRCIANGAKGVKVHPSIGKHLPDHPNMMAVYERLQETELPILTDSTSRVTDGERYGMPFNWRPVLSQFPRLRFIMAHFCDQMWDDRLDLSREFTDNLWFDISGGLVDEHHPPGSHSSMPAVQAARVFRKVGIERIMFGSDGPGGGAGEDIREMAAQVMALDLTDDEKELILAGNARAFLGL